MIQYLRFSKLSITFIPFSSNKTLFTIPQTFLLAFFLLYKCPISAYYVSGTFPRIQDILCLHEAHILVGRETINKYTASQMVVGNMEKNEDGGMGMLDKGVWNYYLYSVFMIT